LDRIISNLCETVDKVYTFFDSLRVIIDDFQEVAYLDGDRPKPNRICSSSVGVRQSTRRRATWCQRSNVPGLLRPCNAAQPDM